MQKVAFWQSFYNIISKYEKIWLPDSNKQKQKDSSAPLVSLLWGLSTLCERFRKGTWKSRPSRPFSTTKVQHCAAHTRGYLVRHKVDHFAVRKKTFSPYKTRHPNLRIFTPLLSGFCAWYNIFSCCLNNIFFKNFITSNSLSIPSVTLLNLSASAFKKTYADVLFLMRKPGKSTNKPFFWVNLNELFCKSVFFWVKFR